MTFTYLNYMPFVIFFLVLLIYLIVKTEKEYFKWVELHWFYKRTFLNKISTFFYLIGFGFLLIALLDLRGPESNIEGNVKDQKTIILIDSSSSMLAEDVRPNRFKRALILARHFTKKAVGHQISLMVFSDGHKQIVPFTKDFNLVDAKLAALENLYLERGGTGLTQSIQEAIQYFKADGLKNNIGNILVFTDAEETTDLFNLKIPDSVSVALVGVGTLKGATIPLRDQNGIFRGNLNYEGQQVISKLDEEFLKKLAQSIKNYQYWIASSYSLPTEQILSFFNNSFSEKISKDNFRVRPVLADYLIIPAILFWIISYLLKFFKTYRVLMFLICFFTFTTTNPLLAQSESKKEKSEHIKKLEQNYLEGKLDKKGRLHLADKLLKEGFAEEAKTIYEESLGDALDDDNKNQFFNMATSQLKSDDLQGGVNNFLKLLDHLEKSKKEEDQQLLKDVQKNLMKVLHNVEKQQQQQKKDEKKKDDKKDSKSKSDDEQKNDEVKKDDKGDKSFEKDENGDVKEKNKNGDSKQNDENGDSKEKDEKGESKEKDDESKNNSKENKEDDKNDSEKDANGNGEKEDSKKKIPALLKQLMSDDNQLQKEFIDAETKRRSRNNRKDW